MWKKIRIPLLVALSLVLLAAVFSWRMNFLNAPLRIALQDLTGQPVSFSRVEYRLFNRITLVDCTVGTYFRCAETTVYFNPFKLLLNYRRPETALTRVHFQNPRLAPSDEIGPLIDRLRSDGKGGASSLKITWENGQLTAASLRLSQFSGRLKSAGGGVSGRMAAKVGENTVSVALDSLVGAASRARVLAKMNGPGSSFELRAEGTRREDGSIEASGKVVKGEWQGFSLNGSTAVFTLDSKGFSGGFSSRMGTITLHGKDFSHFDFNADVLLEALRTDTSGHMLLNGRREDGSILGEARLTGVTFNTFKVGDVYFAFSRASTDAWKANGRIDPVGYSFAARLSDRAELGVYLMAGAKGFGKITGTLSPVRLETRFSGWPMASLPLIASMYPGLDGSLDVAGELHGDKWKLDVTGNECRTVAVAPFSFSGRLIGYDGDWFGKAESKQQGWSVSGKLLKSGGWDFQLSAKDLAIRDLQSMTRLTLPVQGTVTGLVSYASSRKGSARLEANGLTWNGTPLGDGKVDVEMDPKTVHVRNISLYRDRGTVTGAGELGLAAPGNAGSLDLTFHHYPAGANELHGRISVTGEFLEENGGEFRGEIAGAGFRFGKWTANTVQASFTCSRQRIMLPEFSVLPFARGDAALFLTTGAIRGRIAILGFPLEDLAPGLKGRLQGAAELSGTIGRPRIVLAYSVPDTVYKHYPFSQSGTVRMMDNTVVAENVVISSGACTVTVNGKLWPELNALGSFDKLPVAMLGNFGAPGAGATGALSGTVAMRGALSRPRINIDLAGQGLAFGKTPVNELRAGAVFADNQVHIDTFTARFSDSEFRILPGGTVDLAAKKFSLRSDWRNVHLGPCDLFGTMKLSGSWQAGGNKPLSVNAVLSGSDLWLNQHNVDSLQLAFAYRDGGITFLPRDGRPVQVSGSIDLSAYPLIRFRKLNVQGGKQRSLTIDGEFGASRWDFAAAGRSLPAESLAELLDAPLRMSGSADVSIVGKGSVERPQLEAGLTVADGMVSDVPFDTIRLQLSARQDVVTVIHAKLIRRNLYTISASGYAPFALTAEGYRRVRNNPVDLSLNIEEGSLDILRGVSGDVKSAKGDLRAQAHLTGTLSAPVGSGYLKIANGEIQSRRYFSRLGGLNVDCSWNNNAFKIRECSGRIGDGLLRLSGSVTLSGLEPRVFNLSLKTEGNRGIPITVPELPIPSPLLKAEDWDFLSNYSRAEPRMSLHFTGPADNPKFSGWVELDNTHFTYPSLLKRAKGESILDSLWPRLNWDFEIRTGKNCWYDNELVTVNATGGVKLTGKGAYPRVNGHIEAVRGTVTYFGTEFTIRRAELDIVNDACYLQAEADSQVFGTQDNEADIIQMFIDKSDVATMQPRFVSKNNPNLTPAQAMTKATGLNIDSMSPAEAQYYLRKSLIRFFDSTLTTPLAKNLLRRSGLVDSFHVQYKSQGQSELPQDIPGAPVKAIVPENPSVADYLAGTKYSMEKYLTDRMLFGYSMTFDQNQSRLDLRHELEVSYNLLQNLFLKGSYELETQQSSLRPYDRRITLEQQFRFGWFGSPKPAPARKSPKTAGRSTQPASR